MLPLALFACASRPFAPPSPGHIGSVSRSVESSVPPPSLPHLVLPPPQAPSPLETYSVLVTRVPVQDLLFALARDAHLDIDVHSGLSGSVTLNAIDQTLPQILDRLARQVDMRYEIHGRHLAVMPDTPFLRSYRLDYVNLNRSMTGTVSTNTQIATSSSGGTPATGNAALNPGGLAAVGNVSAMRIENTSRNQLWGSVEKNLRDLLRETDKILPEGSSDTVTENTESASSSGATTMPASGGTMATNRSRHRNFASHVPISSGPTSMQNNTVTTVHKSTFREAASVIANRESGVLTVRATARQHEKVSEFIERVTAAARRQVLIEATIVEVSLGDTYRQGIEWSRILASGTRFGITGPGLGSTAGNAITPFSIAYKSADGIDATVKLLESFGTVKVLSSPKLAVLNNQTAAIKVVEEYVYFSVKADTTQTSNAGVLTTVTTTPQSVSVGLVMTVTPQVSDRDEVILNVRPTISSISDFRRDPNPSIPSGIANLVPQIRTREIESVLRIENGETAILGGLMEDRIDYKTGRVPVLGQIPLLGELFTNRDNDAQKTELVIFLRPVVIADARLAGIPATLRESLPGSGFFSRDPVPGTSNFPAPLSTRGIGADVLTP